MEILRRPHRARCRRACTTTTIGALAAALASNTARALENDGPITPFGVFDFGAGIMPQPTPNGTLATRFAYYSTHTIRNGGSADFSLTVASWMHGVHPDDERKAVRHERRLRRDRAVPDPERTRECADARWHACREEAGFAQASRKRPH
ncbi:hypothetical protein [Burkholderia cenocepacia]|uniref:hypothetical protein n=1 Tax=Burkholderia cenocepacia TaxID=95486 RepID=UPI00286EB9C8|nr:hypothetical protein [Burkholderia cenocepacia]